MTSLSPTIHLIDDDAAVRESLALLIGTVGLRVTAWADPQAFLDSFDQDKPETKAFIEKFMAEYKTEPFSLSAYGYNALVLVKDVIERAGSTDREKIRAAFETTQDFRTVLAATGTTLTFSPKQRAGFPDKGAVMRLIENNKHGKAVFSGY